MINDSQTNKVYLAQGITHYKPAYLNLLKAFSEENVDYEFLPMTQSKKHVWARDFMPIQDWIRVSIYESTLIGFL